MSAVLLIVVSATVLLMVAMLMVYMTQGPVGWLTEFQENSERCERRGGECVKRSECSPSNIVSGECEDLDIQNTGSGTGSVMQDKVCCFETG